MFEALHHNNRKLCIFIRAFILIGATGLFWLSTKKLLFYFYGRNSIIPTAK